MPQQDDGTAADGAGAAPPAGYGLPWLLQAVQVGCSKYSCETLTGASLSAYFHSTFRASGLGHV